MAVVLHTLAGYYKYLFYENQDPLTKSYPLIESSMPIIVILVVYNSFVLSWGPKFMEKRRPYDLKTIMLLYNAIQVLANAFLAITAFKNTFMAPDHSFLCQPISYTDTPARRRLAWLTYLYFLNKISDLLDTVFFVLRKRNNQITFLHVYHHTGIVIGSYFYSKYLSGSHGMFLGTVNTFVHSIMYLYYFMTLISPGVKNSLGWKKYITQLQMVQFAAIFVYFAIPLIKRNCIGYPSAILFIGATQNLFMFTLFFDFYNKTYLKKNPKHFNG